MESLTDLVGARRGHFAYESGHHGDLWLELDALFVHPRRVAPFCAELARRLAPHGADVVCGPLIGGAFVAQAVATELVLNHTAERLAAGEGVPLESIATLSSGLWAPDECPRCAAGEPLSGR